MKKSIIVLLHIGFWTCYLFMIMIMLGLLFKNNTYEEARINLFFKYLFGFALLPSFISFYIFYLFVFPNYLKYKNRYKTIIYSIVSSLIIALIGTIFISIIDGDNSLYYWREDFFEGLFSIFVITLVFGIIALILKGSITWFNDIKQKEALQQKNHEMEMALVKSQLDPHFLFNTINNIDVLIIKNANEASNYLNKLSDIIRFMLFETKTEKIPLSKEIEYIKKYIELQKIRTANSNYINFKITGSFNGKTIAPMVFIPFIENAFKHTTNKKLNNAITIMITINDEFIKLNCVNKLDSNRKLKQESNGLGNELIKKRLNLIYPEKHTLEVINQNSTYSVQLTINNGKI
ncbi:sensor histidine kinase [Flavivirga spongiicola]|uniref:Sensor histidine kinase n=1 Tax=Flavivirga spongiicola TaxID=421621 RepID=A0ABU7XLR2_9FLAO|nr:sensor histidine kinase [Flavivirga sp. MEBiC05379]MDO5981368.1 sensor histidine kinase [Flavivirga sp. MEBiC05379]